MNTYQVTARFGRNWEIVGADEVTHAEAHRLANVYRNVGREVRIHQIIGSGSRLVETPVQKDTNVPSDFWATGPEMIL